MTTSKKRAFHPHRVVVLVACMLAQLHSSGAYLWSLFRPYAIELFGWNDAQATMPFTCIMLCFVVGNLIWGPIQDRFGPRRVILAGSIMLGTGHWIAAMTPTDAPWILLASYGVFASIGGGGVYNAALTTVQRLFPDKRGFATGLLMAMVGMAGAILSPVISFFLVGYGFRAAMAALGTIYFVFIFASSFFVYLPPQPEQRKEDVSAQGSADMPPAQVLRSGQYYKLMFSMLLAIPAYFLISPLLVTLSTSRGLSATVAVAAVGLSSVVNILGRFVASWATDKLGAKRTVVILDLITLGGALAMFAARGYLLLILVFAVTFAYGGVMSTYPTLSILSFGAKHAGANYSLVMVGFGLASVLAQSLPGLVAQLGDPTSYSLLIAGACAAVSLILVLTLRGCSKNKGMTDERKMMIC